MLEICPADFMKRDSSLCWMIVKRGKSIFYFRKNKKEGTDGNQDETDQYYEEFFHTEYVANEEENVRKINAY